MTNYRPLFALLLAALLATCSSPPPDAKVSVLVKGAAIRGTNGLAFNAENRLYVASVRGREIVVVDPDSGEVLNRIGPEQDVKGPDDVIFGADGSLYWTDIFAGEVGRLAPDGSVTKQLIAMGVNPITVSDNGRLFVGLDFFGDALYELDPELTDPPRLIVKDFGSINGMDFGPDGLLYGPSRSASSDARDQIVRIDVDSGELKVVAEGLPNVSAVKFDSRGQLYARAGTGVGRVNTATGEYDILAPDLGQIDNLAFDSQDRLFVSHSPGRISEVLADGTTRTVVAGGLIAPGGLAVDDERVLVADWSSLREYDGTTGRELAFHQVPSGTTVSAHNGRFILSNMMWTSGRQGLFDPHVQIWDREKVESHLGFIGLVNAIGFGDAIIVAELGQELGSGRVIQIDGDERRTLASAHNGLGTPTGLAARGNDLWVTDWETGCLYQLAEGEEPRLVASDLARPEGIAFTPTGRLLVAETGAGRLTAVDTESGERQTIAEGLEIGAEGMAGLPETFLFTGVAVAGDGTIYVSGDRANLVYRIDGVE